jgi:hypothetical protein
MLYSTSSHADIELDFHVSTWAYSETKAIVVKYVNVVTWRDQ